MIQLTQEQFDNYLSSLFSLKGISYETIEMYAWRDDKRSVVQKLDDLKKLGNFYIVFYLTDVKLEWDNIPVTFDWFSFTCSCNNGACGNLYLSPDIFGFNSEIKLTDDKISEIKDSLTNRLYPIAQSLFSLL
jgi:hypothetical protein